MLLGPIGSYFVGGLVRRELIARDLLMPLERL